jgi:hypothetical protein
MTLVVEAPAPHEPERRYILDVVLADWLGLDWRLEVRERRDVAIALEGDAEGRLVLPDTFFSAPEESWLEPRSLPAAPLARLPVPDLAASPLARGERLPVLYGAGHELVRGEPPALDLGVDVLGGCFFMLSRYEERVLPAHDGFGRFPAAASVAAREGFLGLPLADAYAELLWAALHRLWPRLERRRRAYRVVLTHDVDDPLASLGRGALQRIRQLGADGLRRRDPALMARRVRSWAGSARGDHRHDPYNTFEFLMDVSERHGLASAFYFLATAGTASPHDPPYTLDDPWIRALLRRVHERGHELGFHAGFETYRDPDRTREEFERLRRAAERDGVRQDEWGGRQHYLRWENPTTWSNWDRAGLAYDTTLAFADRIGFRAGTCHEYRAFHLLERRPLRLRERPFQVMDATVFEYMALSPDAAHAAIVALARECRRYGGILSLLWHNSALMTGRRKRWYEQLVGAVSGTP